MDLNVFVEDFIRFTLDIHSFDSTLNKLYNEMRNYLFVFNILDFNCSRFLKENFYN
jgi:hypothetical protein